MCKVSVIMAVFNESDNLSRSVSSILNQSFGDFEFIICDDGSSDASADTLQSLTASDKRVRLLRNPVNQGHAYSLNRCLSIANGQYIARMDADDETSRERLAKQVDFLDSHPEYDFCGTNILCVESTGRAFRLTNPEIPSKRDFLWGTCFCHPTVMFRTQALKRAEGYRVAEETRKCEDYDLFMRMYAKGMHGYNIQEILYRYHFREREKNSFRNRCSEAKVRYRGFRNLGLLPGAFFYVIKPLAAWMMPGFLIRWIRQKRYGSDADNGGIK